MKPIALAKPVRTRAAQAKLASAVQTTLSFDGPRATPAPKASKPETIPVRSTKTAPAAKPKTADHAVKVVQETVFESGALWKMSGKNGVAYVKDAALAGELLATEPKNLAKRAMAVYYDKKGKAFAWQVRFDTERWEEVMRRLG